MSHRTKNYKLRPKIITQSNPSTTFYYRDHDDDPIEIDDVKIKFPFKSRDKFESVKDQIHDKTFNPIVDKQPKIQMKNYSRPYFSPKFLSWEADLVYFTSKTKKPLSYMFIINVNTKFLYVVFISDKSEDEMINAFMNLFQMKTNNVQCPNGIRINNLRFDGESSLNSKLMKRFYDKYKIKTYSNSSRFINKNRIVDRVIRTIRSAWDNLEIGDVSLKKHRQIMQQIVSLYNNSIHKSTGIKPIKMTFEDELNYIKNKELELRNIMSKQREDGMLNYKPGDKLKLYLPSSKVNRFTKKHIYYSTPAKFISYNHGNVIAETDGGIVEVPIYYAVPAQNL